MRRIDIVLSVSLAVLLTQSAWAGILIEDFDGSNGAWSATGGNSASPSFEVNGDFLGGMNGWESVPNRHGHRIVHGQPNNNVNDIHFGIGMTQGAGNSAEGCIPHLSDERLDGCASAHPFDFTGDITFSVFSDVSGINVLAANDPVAGDLPYAGTGRIIIGDSSFVTGGPDELNAYRLTFDSSGFGGSIELIENGVNTQMRTALLQTGFRRRPTGAQKSWVEFQIVISDVGTAEQSAFAQWRDIDDETGEPIPFPNDDVFKLLGTFDVLEGDVFPLNYIGIESTKQFRGGASLIPFDNVSVVPEPASLTLMALGGLMMLRRRRSV